MCFNPKFALYNYELNDKGKLTKKLKFIAKLPEEYTKTVKPENYIVIPCGKCIACRIEKANQYASRCILEAERYKQKCFVTLSYRPKDLPENGTLVVKDIQDFMKRLRKKIYPQKIRYFACGEYGDKTLRAHYHLLIYNYYPRDAKFFKYNKSKQPLYISKELADTWGKGFIIFGDVTYESAGYVARYTQKKIYNKHDELMEKMGRHKEFLISSRRPGIGLFMFGKDKLKNTIITNNDVFDKIKRNFGVLIKQNGVVKLKNVPTAIRNKWREIDEMEYYTYSDKHLKEVKDNINKIIEKKGITEEQYTKEQKEITYERLSKLRRETF